MAQTAGTPEPTMEEILASIRRIISEDTDEQKPAAPSAAPPASQKPVAKAAPAPAPEPEDEEDVLELTDVVEDEAPPPPPRRPEPDDLVMVERPAPRPPAMPAPRFAQEQQLISDRVRDQASQHFMQLSRNVLVSDADPRSLEAIVQQMLRPMLMEWLNDHLPTMVERMVQEEIERVSSRGRR